MERGKLYDIVIVGGGVAGSITAISLKRKNPILKILLIEKNLRFPNKVGESTSEITALFLNRFNINHILDKQIHKTGLRFLFNEKMSSNKKDWTEFSSPSLKSIANGYQLNRQQFDEDLLIEAKSLGIELIRPAEIISINHLPFKTTLLFTKDGNQNSIITKWLIDASGTARLVSKQLEWGNKNLTFSTSAAWAHLTNLKPSETWDLPESKYWKENAIGNRSNSTIHFLREGLWIWHIRINNESTSFGIVYDSTVHKHESPTVFFEEILKNDKQMKFITAGSLVGEIKEQTKLPFISNKLYGEGIVTIGDSSAFIDPLFSPGIEFTCQQSIWLTDLLTDYFKNSKMNKKSWGKYERTFLNAFKDRVLIYENRYKLMGSYDLLSNWIQLDFFSYFSFSIFPSVIFPKRIKKPPRLNFTTRFLYRTISNRYLKIYQKRKKEGRISSSLKGEVTFSSVSVPKGVMLFIKSIELGSIWFKNYLKIEITELYFYFKKVKID